MFCYQCEQTAKGQGCDKIGVCGKNSEVAELQDQLIHGAKGLSQIAVKARELGIIDDDVNRFIAKAVFTTLTNVNFDGDRIIDLIKECTLKIKSLKEKIQSTGSSIETTIDCTCISKSKDELIACGKSVGIKSDSNADADILSLQQLLIYGIKGVAAYADHATILGKSDDLVYSFIQKGLAATLDKDLDVNDLLELVLKCGEINLKAMELLDAANTETYGHPVPTKVCLGAKQGKAILVSGHDLKDLEEILKQSQGKGINVYTHGEMLPCHGYPELKKYDHFYGHYGTAWQNQAKEFAEFPGAILMTTNCIQKPKQSYQNNIFTTGLVGWPKITHIANHDFSPVIEKALEMKGFTLDVPGKNIMVGFARNAVLGVADKVIDGVKSGAIKHFFLVAGCDGAKSSRNYYTELVEKIPNNCVVLTLACGKFRFFDMDLGDIGGIPRLLDIGQCNDAYSAIQIAVALSNAFNCSVNELPLSMILSWYEQKAVSILLTLLYLGIKNIRLGPSLPAFISPNVLNILVEKFNIMPISTPDDDLKAILK
ncbi:MAG: hydroxylamine reductase [Desulfobacteraceae bacterium 4572_130]|nr:MAG: hydroxylamine reductase [Desulfobacteraceae bacterium 4572_130]